MFSVASYNIRKSVGTDWRRRPGRILEVLDEIDADIVALQEIDRRFGSRTSSIPPEAIEHESPYTALRFGPRPASLGWHGNTILVRKGLEILDTRRIVLPALEPRGAVLADVRFDAQRVRFIGMHLGLVGFWRTRQSLAVLDFIEKLEERLPTVIMGDLNQWTADGGSVGRFAQHHHVIAPGPSFHASRPVVALDRIITSRDIALMQAGVHLSERSRKASDHLPVWARLKIDAAH
ncbi:Metal-dependent hydrolase, endonuclease/exonuclease/phosphatase family [Devosia enhydra]|uniref:Metal-dependent hydrolase, endonuclease/exonuclease/phosphatase family n=1 Tax=Devosia enhydra TaxID=665118 RepID=A0A1K2HVZ5_9HYPH|nr:endonuclease/exonuclease/phosphatase family protein [Devosia enhydra]SFZ82836.1 Metal-dependent hydrolase, endonuclease/exonuclease/phosphatase family [Devosia enhydra]